MSLNKLTKTNNRFLYETAAAATPTSWSVIAQGYTWADNGRLFRVTADEAYYQTIAYVMQKTNTSGDFEDAITINLNLPDGNGISRVDVYTSEVVSGTPDYTTLSLADTLSRQSEQDRIAFEQQTMLESEIGIVFDYAGAKYRATETSRTDSKEIENGGFVEGFELILTTSRKQWIDAGVVPILGAHVTASGVKYRVGEITKNNAHYQLNLNKRHGR